MLASHFQQIF